MNDAMQEMRDQDLSREERTEKMDKLRTEAGKKLMAALTTDQQSKYEALKGEPVKIDMAQFRMGRGGRGGGGGRGGDGGGVVTAAAAVAMAVVGETAVAAVVVVEAMEAVPGAAESDRGA